MPDKYHIRLKGQVGGADFDAAAVESTLKANSDAEVSILIDSLGGALPTALTIAGLLADHGNVKVHFVGLNASAATIASLGAKEITIDSGAMYLVHKCSTGYLDIIQGNSDDIERKIEELRQLKDHLLTFDDHAAAMYARRCKKPAADLYRLMQRETWLTAEQALEWGFVDRITDGSASTRATLTASLATAMVNHGLPLPAMPIQSDDSLIERLINKITELITPKKMTESNKSELEELKAELAARDKTIAELQAKLDAKPGAEGPAVINENNESVNTEDNPVDAFYKAVQRVHNHYKR